MKKFEQFNTSNPMHVSILGFAAQLALDETLENAADYLNIRFQVAPLKALEALFSYSLGYQLTDLQLAYVAAYHKAESHHIEKMNNKLNSIIESESDYSNYPDDFDPDLYDL